jgi:thiamine biosynthesis protein ThiI
MEDLEQNAWELIRQRPFDSFRIDTRRGTKTFPHTSVEINQRVGAFVKERSGAAVDLENAARTCWIEIVEKYALLYTDRTPGPGGLPTGTGGKVAVLLSGGIDSPVAAWRLMRRGCRAIFVHFHSYPILSATSQEKARELVATLTRHQLRSRLFLVPFGSIQQQVVVAVPPPLRVVVYRRLMLRIAERLAHRVDARALVTGDSVGQVASQTIDNLAVVGGVTKLPLLRPLVGFDKEDITADARRLGTYQTSIVPDEDCCTLFTPRFPATRASAPRTEAAEAVLDVEALVAAAAGAAVVEDFQFPVLRLAAHVGPQRAGDTQ